MIDVHNLVVQYGQTKILNNLNMQVKRNESCAIIGPSGCGKTTLLYQLAGLRKPNEGKIIINGTTLTDIRDKTGVILQNYGLLPWKTVWDNAGLGLKLRGFSKNHRDNVVKMILTELNVYQQRRQYPTQLSGGQQQRIAIARAISIEPDILLMDEPFSALDAITRESLQDLMIKLYHQKQLTIVLITHNIEEAVFLGEKIIIMHPSNGTIKKIIDNPHFGDKAFRNTTDFHKLCVEVRSEMAGRPS
ncbi:taurine import ATP-binding protein TauB [Paraliobacillus ryukyuensis]|uniref:NitT/TauT family transport system ATP-binding protein n=1 Tax=Paraliobacillus ryukyuensis TaxID=200904 RepID=A0A366DWW6_9BACI|nr:ABC transporter ATP-binding protein [Paraliobacillus ryukyuensis]RBO94580.1 NitT/TauT family transport system ATP-binding protein [Paraliobacillus ryukyuensis]